MKRRFLIRYQELREVWEDYPVWQIGLGIMAACLILNIFFYLMVGLDAPLPPLKSVTQVELTSADYEGSRVHNDEFGITKCYAHLNFNTQYKLWFPEEEDRPLTVTITHGDGEEFTLQLGQTTISFGGKTFPLKQDGPGDALNTLTEHLLLEE